MKTFIERRPADAITPLLVSLEIRLAAVEALLIEISNGKITSGRLRRRAERAEREHGGTIHTRITERLSAPDAPGLFPRGRRRAKSDR